MINNYFYKQKIVLWVIPLIIVIPLFVYLFITFSLKEETRFIYSDFFSVFIDLIAFGALSLGALQTRLVSKRLSYGWGLMALAVLCTLVGDSIWGYFEIVLKTAPYPSIADLFYILFYPAFFAGLIVLLENPGKSENWILHGLNIAIIVAAFLLLFWIFLFNPFAGNQRHLPASELFLTFAYPISDLVLLLGLLFLTYFHSKNSFSGPILFLGSSISLLIIADFLFSIESAEGLYVTGSYIDLLYWISTLFVGYAGYLQAKMVPENPKSNKLDLRFKKLLLKGERNFSFAPYFAIAGAYLLLFLFHANPGVNTSILFGGVGFVISLVVIRQIIVLTKNDQLVARLTAALNRLNVQSADLENLNRELTTEIDKRNYVEEQLTHEVLHDSLTGLANRTYLGQRFTQVLEEVTNSTTFDYSVLFLDLDNFKVVNDIFGHTIGDFALLELGSRLHKCIRGCDILARFGGDEFVILLENNLANEQHDENYAISIANTILEELERPYYYQNRKILLNCSIGIVQSIKGYKNSEDVFKDADIAMYAAKRNGKARFEVFTIEMGKTATYMLKFDNEVQRGVENDEFFLQYQPIFNISNNEISGFEALIRWQHPVMGLLMPGEFLPIAEETFSIQLIGDWVLLRACEQMCKWVDCYPNNKSLILNVNISGKQIENPDFVKNVLSILKKTGLPPTQLRLEITENTLIHDQQRINDTLKDLRQLGVTFSIDDFGTGYSSFSNLNNFSVDEVKIDRSFTIDIREGKKNFEICKSIINVAKNLNIRTVVEGIEELDQLEIFNSLNCDCAQGYYFSKPVNPWEIEDRYLGSIKQKEKPINTTSGFNPEVF